MLRRVSGGIMLTHRSVTEQATDENNGSNYFALSSSNTSPVPLTAENLEIHTKILETRAKFLEAQAKDLKAHTDMIEETHNNVSLSCAQFLFFKTRKNFSPDNMRAHIDTFTQRSSLYWQNNKHTDLFYKVCVMKIHYFLTHDKLARYLQDGRFDDNYIKHILNVYDQCTTNQQLKF